MKAIVIAGAINPAAAGRAASEPLGRGGAFRVAGWLAAPR